MNKLTIEDRIKASYLFSENYYDPFEKPYKVGDEIEVIVTEGITSVVKILETSIIDQYRQYKLEFEDKSNGWFTLTFIKNKLN